MSQLSPLLNIYEAPAAVTMALATGERPSEWSTRKMLQQVPIVGKLYEAWGVGVPFTPFKDLNTDIRHAVGRPPVDPLGAFFGSPDAYRPGHELYNYKETIRKYKDVYKNQESDEAKSNQSWWRDTQY